MSWLQRLIHRLLPRDRYHDQANEVNLRGLRVHALRQRLQVIERRHEGR